MAAVVSPGLRRDKMGELSGVIVIWGIGEGGRTSLIS